jgi:hypothetical protein
MDVYNMCCEEQVLKELYYHQYHSNNGVYERSQRFHLMGPSKKLTFSTSRCV